MLTFDFVGFGSIMFLNSSISSSYVLDSGLSVAVNDDSSPSPGPPIFAIRMFFFRNYIVVAISVVSAGNLPLFSWVQRETIYSLVLEIECKLKKKATDIFG